MPLLPTTLVAKIREFNDEKYENFTGFPKSPVEAAAKWAAALDAYTGSGALVFPPSTTGAAAKTAFEIVMATSNPATAMVQFDLAFLTYATTLGLGMAPAFVATPPPTPLTPLLAALVPAALVPPGVPAAVQIGLQASVIDTWFRTALATPPGGSPVPWA